MIDTQRVIDAITQLDISPLAREAGAQLVDGYVEKFYGEPLKVVAVETGFSISMGDTHVIGVIDLVAEDAEGLYAREFKSHREPSKYWGEKEWVASIRKGHQIATYALAMKKGVFYETGKPIGGWYVEKPRVQVRACVKTTPPQFWPKVEAESWVIFDDVTLQAVENAYRAKAAAIRAVRKVARPWQLPGDQCRAYNRDCEFLEECVARVYPEGEGIFQESDPAFQLAYPHIEKNENTVILSASSYGDYSRCMELGKRKSIAMGKEANLAMDTGTAMHTGLSCYHQQILEQQNSLDRVTQE